MKIFDCLIAQRPALSAPGFSVEERGNREYQKCQRVLTSIEKCQKCQIVLTSIKKYQECQIKLQTITILIVLLSGWWVAHSIRISN